MYRVEGGGCVSSVGARGSASLSGRGNRGKQRYTASNASSNDLIFPDHICFLSLAFPALGSFMTRNPLRPVDHVKGAPRGVLLLFGPKLGRPPQTGGLLLGTSR